MCEYLKDSMMCLSFIKERTPQSESIKNSIPEEIDEDHEFQVFSIVH